jgi:hypothetical protein
MAVLRGLCRTCGIRETKSSELSCRLCVESPEISKVVTDRILTLMEFYAASEEVLKRHGVNVCDDPDDDDDEHDILDEELLPHLERELSVINELEKEGKIYDHLHSHRFRSAARLRSSGMSPVPSSQSPLSVAGVRAMPGADGGSVCGIAPDSECHQPRLPVSVDKHDSRGRGHRVRRAGRPGTVGLFDRLEEGWPRRAKFQAWETVIVSRPGCQVEGGVVGVEVSGGVRLYTVQYGDCRFDSVPEYICRPAYEEAKT